MVPDLSGLHDPRGLTLKQARKIVRSVSSAQQFRTQSPFPALLELREAQLGEGELPSDTPEEGRQLVIRQRLSSCLATEAHPPLRLFFLHPGASSEDTCVGRSGVSSDVVVPNTTVSKRHVRFAPTRNGYSVIDLESQNGTFLEGRRLAAGVATALAGGQLLALASFRTLFLGASEVWNLLRGEGAQSGPSWPPEGMAVRNLVTLLIGGEKESFLASYPFPFLLQVPTLENSEDTPSWGGGHDGTVSLSRTRILGLKRRKSELGAAKVHYLSPQDGSLLLGRSAEDSDLVLGEPTVSKKHAEMRPGKSGWGVVDLGSQNGTFVEGKRLQPGLVTGIVDGQSLWFSSYRTLFLTPARLYELAKMLGAR